MIDTNDKFFDAAVDGCGNFAEKSCSSLPERQVIVSFNTALATFQRAFLLWSAVSVAVVIAGCSGESVVADTDAKSATESVAAAPNDRQLREMIEEQATRALPNCFAMRSSKDGDSQIVSLNLPSLCCEDCAAAIRRDLSRAVGISSIDVDLASTTVTFRASQSVNVRKFLEHLAIANKHFRAWSQSLEDPKQDFVVDSGKASDTKTTSTAGNDVIASR